MNWEKFRSRYIAETYVELPLLDNEYTGVVRDKFGNCHKFWHSKKRTAEKEAIYKYADFIACLSDWVNIVFKPMFKMQLEKLKTKHPDDWQYLIKCNPSYVIVEYRPELHLTEDLVAYQDFIDDLFIEYCLKNQW